MQKLVIDTNVFVSYLISKKGFSFKIVDEVLLERKVEHYVSEATLLEYLGVFSKTRFVKKYADFYTSAYQLFGDIIKLSNLVEPFVPFNIIKDENDNRFLEVAYACIANYLITGNTHHFTFSSFYTTQIVSPRLYWEHHQPKSTVL